MTVSTVWFGTGLGPHKISFQRITEKMCWYHDGCMNVKQFPPPNRTASVCISSVSALLYRIHLQYLHRYWTTGSFFFNLLLSLSLVQWAASGPLGPKPWQSALCRSQLQLSDKDTPTPAREDDRKYNTASSLAASAQDECLSYKSMLQGW